MTRARRIVVAFLSRIGLAFETCDNCRASVTGRRCVSYREQGVRKRACSACVPAAADWGRAS